MNAPTTEQRRPVRLRFSLLSGLLFVTIVALAIVVVLQSRRLWPLEREVRRLRAEVGALSIDDRAVTHATQLRQQDLNLWQWRIYLPPGRPLKLVEYVGRLPGRAGKSDEQWLQELENAVPRIGRSSLTSGGEQGEFTLRATLLRQESGWKFSTSPGGGSSIYPFQSDWPADTGRIASSGVPIGAQRQFARGKPIVLLYLSTPKRTATPGGVTRSEFPSDAAEGMVLLLEQ
jgi:hypothetical protein